MNNHFIVRILLTVALLRILLEAKTIDPYKVLGVERNASQREIQKAFHKLSLQYHPDKNKNKGAQEKFADINNAYDILSNEEKRKNYDLYGDERGSPGFQDSRPSDQGGYSYFSGGDPGQSQFSFKPSQWKSMGGQGGSKSFSFSFGGPSGPTSFGFGMDDIFSNFFGGNVKSGDQFSGFGGGTSSQSRFKPGPQSGSRSYPISIKAINFQVYKKEISDQGMTWLLFSYTSSLRANQQLVESVTEEVSSSLQGALKVGSINCETEQSLCENLGIFPHRVLRIFVYSYKASDKGSLVEYGGDLTVKDLKTFCQSHLPRFSKRVDLKQVELLSTTVENWARLLLLSTKKDTPVIWRVLSGLYHKRFIFYDAEIHDVSDPTVKKLGVDALPAIVGWLSNGEKHILKIGIVVKDLKSAVQDLGILLDGFEKENKKVASSQARKAQTMQLPLLTSANFNVVCGETYPVCIIGTFKSSKSREKLESILTMVSQKSLSRRSTSGFGSKDPISYALLDTGKQPGFLKAFDKSGFKSSDNLLLAYKPSKGKFAAFEGPMTAEEVERFIGYVLNGDIQFTKIRQKPTLK